MGARNVLIMLAGVILVISFAGFAYSQTSDPPGGTDAETCYACHDQVVTGMADQIHMRIRGFEVQGRAVGCEGCHGDGTRHAEQADPELIRSFEGGANQEVCISCHRGDHMFQWGASVHAVEGIDCLDCHSIHRETEPLDTCESCHAEVTTRFQLPSHHPVREGKMSCVSCHDPHAATESHLKTGNQRVNDLCYTCHLEIEGPWIFEHEPVQEDCRLCHTPHGSVANNLLVANEPMLCLQCHDFHFHAGYRASEDEEVEVGGREFENPLGPRGFNIAMSTKCTQCHSRVHGSDLPSQTVAGKGQGLTQ